MLFENKTAFITGAARGIGAAMATEISKLGGAAVIADVDIEAARHTADSLGSAMAFECDVSDPDSVDLAMKRVADEYGGIDILVNNAGLHLMAWNRPVTELTTDEWRRLLDVNVIGIANCARAARPYMAGRDGASVLNLSSIGGVEVKNAYGVSKLAVRGLTTALADELGVDGIRVNALAPGAIDTDTAMEDLPQELLDELILKKQVIKRQGTPRDLVEAMKYLCSEAASFITGETLVVGGGFPVRI